MPKKKAGKKTPMSESETLFLAKFVTGEIRGIIGRVEQGYFMGNEELDEIMALLQRVAWKTGSRGDRLASLIFAIKEADHGSADFTPDDILAIVECMEERIPADLAMPKKK